jgi:predicted phosphodiesterase
VHTGRSAAVWGLVSDVHGNIDALERALLVLQDAGAQKLAFLGDYLGRGDSDACVRRIKDVADIALVGNRDFDWQDRVSTESKAWVLSLPRTACVDGLLLAHGDARLTPALSTTQISRGFVRTWAEMDQADAGVFAFGHSHHARIWRKRNAADTAELLAAACVEIEPPNRYFLNVGTTGLPFPGKGEPSVAVINFSDLRIQQLVLHHE